MQLGRNRPGWVVTYAGSAAGLRSLGRDGSSVAGSWGRSIVNLAPYATANDKVRLRFDLVNDGCGGTSGLYQDDLMVYRCTP